jgi:hypothetical protein
VLGELCERLFLSANTKENELANQIADAVPAGGDQVGRGGCGEPQEATLEARSSGRLIQDGIKRNGMAD